MHLGFIKLLLILLPFVPSLYGVDVLEWKIDSRELENMERYSYTEVQQTESNKLVYRNRTVENSIDWKLSNNKMEEKPDLSIELQSDDDIFLDWEYEELIFEDEFTFS